MFGLKRMNSNWNRDERNNINENWDKLERSFQKVLNDSSGALETVETIESQFNQIVAEAGSNNPEVVQARGGFVNLNKRITEQHIQFTNQISSLGKVRLTGAYDTLLELETAYPNGSEGIFLIKADGHWRYWDVNTEQWEDGGLFQAKEISEGEVDFTKQSFINYSDSGNLFTGYNETRLWASTTNNLISVAVNSRAFILPIESGKIYSIQTMGAHNRFTVALAHSIEVGQPVEFRAINSSATQDEFFQVQNVDGYKYLIVGVSNNNEEPALDVRILNKDIELQDILNEDVTNKKSYKWMDYTTGAVSNQQTQRSVIVPVMRNVLVAIKTKGSHSRFTVGGFIQTYNSANAAVIYAGENNDGMSVGNVDYSFFNTDYDYLIIGVTIPTDTFPIIKLYQEATSSRTILENNSTIDTAKLESGAVTYEKQSFVQRDSYNRLTVSTDGFDVDVSTKTSPIWVNYQTGQITTASALRSIVYKIPNDMKNKQIAIKTIGSHDRFAVSLANQTKSGTIAKVLYAGTNSDGTSTGNMNYTANVEDYKYLILGVSSTDFTAQAKLTLNPGGVEVTGELVNNYTKIKEVDETYPILFGVKMSNKQDVTTLNPDSPRPIGWLYYTPVAPYELLYASGNPNNIQYLCDWDETLTYNKRSDPSAYRPFITKEGDIIFVFRGDELGTNANDSRQNPIIYPANDWNNPKIIDLGSNIKPTSWLQNCGADYIYNQDVFIFSEYTRPYHGTTHIWRVTKPFDNPANWQVVASHVLSGDDNVGMKHCHTSQYDTFSGKIYYTTGDDDSAAQIYGSSDYGLTWSLEYGGLRKYARVLNFVFTQDGAYWANDDSQHRFNFAPRVNGVVDFTQITELYDLTGHPPTYVNALIDDGENYGVLILNRWDGVQSSNYTLDILYWNLLTSTMHTVATLEPLDESKVFGFRVEAVNYYHQRGDATIACGFATPTNNIKILNNYGTTNATKINNLQMKLRKFGTEYKLDFNAVQ